MENIKQLWVLTGPTWRIPIEVEQHDPETARIRLCRIPLLLIQILAADAFIETKSILRERMDFLIRFIDLHAIAMPAEFRDPEKAVVWVPPLETEVDPADEFITAYCQHGGVLPLPVMKLVWASVNAFALYWVSKLRHPIRLGWATIYPMMFRANWKEMVLAMETPGINRKPVKRKVVDPKKFHRADNKWFAIRDAAARQGIEKAVLSGQITALKDEVMRWRLELVPEQPWHDAVEEYEKKCRQWKPRGDYFQKARYQLTVQVKYAVAIYNAWRSETTLPWIRFDKGDPTRHTFTSKHGVGFPVKIPRRTRDGILQEPGATVVVEEKGKKLFSVSALQQIQKDLRDPGHYMGEGI